MNKFLATLCLAAGVFTFVACSSDSDDNFELNIDGKDSESFDVNLITGFENDRITSYAEPLDIYEGFIQLAQGLS